MGRSSFRFRMWTAAQGLRARISASADIWDEPARDEHDWAAGGEDVSDWLKLPPDFRAPDDDESAYRRPSRLPIDFHDGDEPDGEAWSAYGLDGAPVRVIHVDQRH